MPGYQFFPCWLRQPSEILRGYDISSSCYFEWFHERLLLFCVHTTAVYRMIHSICKSDIIPVLNLYETWLLCIYNIPSSMLSTLEWLLLQGTMLAVLCAEWSRAESRLNPKETDRSWRRLVAFQDLECLLPTQFPKHLWSNGEYRYLDLHVFPSSFGYIGSSQLTGCVAICRRSSRALLASSRNNPSTS